MTGIYSWAELKCEKPADNSLQLYYLLVPPLKGPTLLKQFCSFFYTKTSIMFKGLPYTNTF